MLNWIFLFLIAGAVLTAAFNGTMSQVTAAGLNSAKSAVELAIGLVGQMALWLGFMGILREAGLMGSIARGLKPLMTRLFPDVPPEHPAMGAMIMNIAANMLGLGNAATPFGLKAMQELNRLNPHKGVATNSMALFLAINTSGVAVLALGVVAVRATLGSKDPAGVLIPSVLATLVSTSVAITVAKLCERMPQYAADKFATTEAVAESAPKEIAGMAAAEEAAAERPPATGAPLFLGLGVGAALAVGIGRYVHSSATGHVYLLPGAPALFDLTRPLMSDWLLPVLMLVIVTFGASRRVKIYEVFVASAKEGFQIAVMIIPFLVAILVAIGMFRASGAMEMLVSVLTPVTGWVGFPAEALPMALVRPLSGSGALAVMTEAMKTHGPDSFIGYVVSVLNGSTETTFYVLAVYFGSVQVRAVRHTLWACLAADFAGVCAALAVSRIFFA